MVRTIAPLLAAFTMLLAACGGPAAGPAPTAVPSSAPAPTEAPTAAPEPAGALPAPVYFFDEQQQIARLEVDGQTVTPITSEEGPIMQYSVSPADGALLYIVGERPAQTLVQADALGGNRVELLSGSLESPAWMPDGQGYAVAWAEGPDGAGVYRARGGNREVVGIVIDTPFQQDGQRAGVRYTPLAWSPDGSQLLLNAIPDFGPDAPGGDIAVVGRAVTLPDGPAVDLVRSGGDPYLCLDASWGSDGAHVYCANYGARGGTPGLWRIPAAGGEPEVLLPTAADGEQTDVFNAREFGGDVYAFVGDYANDAVPTYTMRRIPAAGGEPSEIRPDAFDINAVVWSLWAPDGSGALVQAVEEGQTRNALLWVPAEGEPVTLGARLQGTPQWGVARP